MIRMLASGGDVAGHRGRGTALHSFIKPSGFVTNTNRRACFEALINAVPDINGRNSDGYTALRLAVRLDDESAVRWLTSTDGVDMNVTDNEGETALHSALFMRKETIADLIIRAAGVDVNSPAPGGLAPLHLAVVSGSYSNTSSLLRKGADVNVVTAEGVTPLHIAVEIGNETVVRLLLDSGANPSIETVDGDTPLDIAKDGRAGSQTIIALLEKHKKTR